ncbi:MAG: hypothetical protein FJZ97_09960 [Chloroflexi bacterium]|nr:hypothetical protein [Chloroflexota bacterium]
MTGNLYRAQILLEPEQHRRLKQIAEREGRSISDVTRSMVAAGLEAVAEQEAVHGVRWNRLERRLRAIREGARARGGLYAGDLVAEIRAERDDQLGRQRDEKA